MSALEVASLGGLGLVLVLGLAWMCWTMRAPADEEIEEECAEWRRREGFDKDGYKI